MEHVLQKNLKNKKVNLLRKDLIEIKQAKFGKGLFAKKNISAENLLYKIPISKKILSFEKTIQLKEKESHALQIDVDKYILCESPFLYSNHSCNPNCGITANFEMIAIKNIKKGEELFWDYSTSMLERHWRMQCACGEKNCRKIITDFDFLPVKFQINYLQRNIVLPFIVHFLQQQHFARSA